MITTTAATVSMLVLIAVIVLSYEMRIKGYKALIAEYEKLGVAVKKLLAEQEAKK